MMSNPVTADKKILATLLSSIRYLNTTSYMGLAISNCARGFCAKIRRFEDSSNGGKANADNIITAGTITDEYNILNRPFSLSTNAGTRRFGYVYGGGKYGAQHIFPSGDG